ncbi:MAG TPA: cyclophilin-like fold protein [Algoriphagus sp.]|nr:cyclophilin-like fold protein [Algoriphagus sp.]
MTEFIPNGSQMKSFFKTGTLAMILLFGLISHAGMSCQSEENPSLTPDSNEMEQSGSKISIQVGSQSFIATLAENAAATALASMLPLTLEMSDLNRNEKFAQLPENLPTNASNPGGIRNGDLMLWGANTFVIFYESFPTSYPYTRLGKIDDPAGLKAALGSGDVTVTFKLEAL